MTSEMMKMMIESPAGNMRIGILVFDQNLSIKLSNETAAMYISQKMNASNESLVDHFRNMILSCELPTVCTISTEDSVLDVEFYKIGSNSEALTLVVMTEREKINDIIRCLRLDAQKNELLEKAVENLFEFFGMVNSDGKLVYLSEKTCTALDIDMNKVRGMRVREVLPDCLLHNVVNTGIPQLRYIYRHGKHSVPAMVIPINEQQEIKGAVCASIFKDISDAHQYLQKIQSITGASPKHKFQRIEGPRYSFNDIIGISEESERTKKIASKIASSEATVLILGETGTGKELYANAIHAASKRFKGPFIRVNCAGIPESLLESELFGYEKGAFTGAIKGGKPGKFELAHKGTIFLDEIGDMSHNVQAKMLRVLQEKEIERLGGTETFGIDVRVIAATNRDLLEMVDQGKFRKDLYYRLAIMSLEIKPLRSRMDDVPILIDYFIAKMKGKLKHTVKGVSRDTMHILMNYSWPGNIRELENVIEGSLFFCSTEEIEPENLPLSFMERVTREKREMIKQSYQADEFTDRDIKEIIHALKECNGNKRKASKLIGMPRSTFYYKLNKLGKTRNNGHVN